MKPTLENEMLGDSTLALSQSPNRPALPSGAVPGRLTWDQRMPHTSDLKEVTSPGDEEMYDEWRSLVEYYANQPFEIFEPETRESRLWNDAVTLARGAMYEMAMRAICSHGYKRMNCGLCNTEGK